MDERRFRTVPAAALSRDASVPCPYGGCTLFAAEKCDHCVRRAIRCPGCGRDMFPGETSEYGLACSERCATQPQPTCHCGATLRLHNNGVPHHCRECHRTVLCVEHPHCTNRPVWDFAAHRFGPCGRQQQTALERRQYATPPRRHTAHRRVSYTEDHKHHHYHHHHYYDDDDAQQ